MMGHGFNKNGHFDLWTSISDYETKEQLDALTNLPLPNGQIITLEEDGIDISKEYALFANEMSLSKVDPLARVENLNLSSGTILAIAKVLYKLKEKNALIDSNSVNAEYINSFISILNKHNTSLDYINKPGAIKNSIISKMRKVISSPTNFLLANEPVDIQALHDGARYAKNKLGFVEDSVSNWDVLSQYKQQQDANIGKEDVGIGANGLKVFFALSDYYNSYYNDFRNGKIKVGNFNTDPKSFHKKFIINGKSRSIYSIANTGVPTDYMNQLLTSYGYSDLMAENLRLSEIQAALLASGFVSGATDNAKELVMAKINAVVDLASMHMYLISLGYDMNDIAVYMNSDLGKYVASRIVGNIFDRKKDLFDTIVDSYLKQNEGSEDEVNQFRDIYRGAQEFKILASVFKVNQKISANVAELNKFLETLETAMYTREHMVLGKHLSKLQKPDEWNNKITFGKGNYMSIIDYIVSQNTLLSNMFLAEKVKVEETDTEEVKKAKAEVEKARMEKIKEYVSGVLKRASEIKVDYIDGEGKTRSKVTGIAGGKFDFRYYMHPNNTDYRNAAIEYYNLFKNTINIFDVIEGVPHFKEMVNAVATTHNVLSVYSKKYNFAFNKMRDIVRNHSNRVVSGNENIKHRFGNPGLPVSINEVTLGKLFRAFDFFMISKWLKEGKKVSKFRFNAVPLLKKAGIEKMLFYKSDQVKYSGAGDLNTYSKILNQEDVVVIDSNYKGEFVIDLKTDYGIANFKMLMERVVLPILKNSKSNLGTQLRLTTVRNLLGLTTTQITSNFPISSLNSPINMQKFQELLTNFNDVDTKLEQDSVILNAEGTIIPYKDLLYVYNLIVNNETYGDKRLTPLFEDYVKYKDTIGREYLNFSSLVDSGKYDVFKLPDVNDPNVLRELELSQIDDLIFLGFNNWGELRLEKAGRKLKLKNSNIPIVTSMEATTTTNSAKYAVLDSILSTVKNKNLIINFNCD